MGGNPLKHFTHETGTALLMYSSLHERLALLRVYSSRHSLVQPRPLSCFVCLCDARAGCVVSLVRCDCCCDRVGSAAVTEFSAVDIIQLIQTAVVRAAMMFHCPVPLYSSSRRRIAPHPPQAPRTENTTCTHSSAHNSQVWGVSESPAHNASLALVKSRNP